MNISAAAPIAVVGAGIVGVCNALWLQRAGYQVELYDSADPGSGTSSGNACTIADYGCIPVNNPRIRSDLLSLLFSKNSPLKLSPIYAIRNIRWLMSFLKHCEPDAVDRIITGLASLLSHTHEGLWPLVEEADATDLFHHQGCLYVYQTKQAFDAAYPYNQRRIESGVSCEFLSSNNIHLLEPGLKKRFHAGLLFPNARQTVNPLQLVQRLFSHFISNGGRFHQLAVVETGSNGEWVKTTDGDSHQSDKVIISAGAFSRRILGAGTSKLPLGTERGYHVQYSELASLISRPVGWAEAGLYATPMNQGLRLAGTVEIAGLNKSASPKALRYLQSRAREMFEITQQPDQTWLGFRPTMPDALPVIGSHSESPGLIYAFGHQHIGLTLAGITGKLVAELVQGIKPSVSLEPFSPSRFA